jgi:hypothetical protein
MAHENAVTATKKHTALIAVYFAFGVKDRCCHDISGEEPKKDG